MKMTNATIVRGRDCLSSASSEKNDGDDENYANFPNPVFSKV